jgi:hypothetical protein
MSAPGDYDNEEIGGIIGRGNRSTRRKPAPVPLCPAQNPHAARTRTRAAAVGSQRLTAELRHGLMDERLEKRIQNFSGEVRWKHTTSKTNTDVKGNTTLDLTVIGQTELAQDRYGGYVLCYSC